MPGVIVICPMCSLAFLRLTKHVAHVTRKSGRWACRSCVTAAKNANAAKQVGATRIHAQSGYIEEKTPAGWRRQHVLIIERSLGRRLAPNEVVHHANEVKTDNRMENLVLMMVGEHTTLHHIGSKRSQSTVNLLRQKARARASTRLTAEAAAQIRAAAATTAQRQLARAYGVSPMTINRVVNNQTWKEI